MTFEKLEAIERVLHDDLERARKRMELAKQKFTVAMAEIPTGLPATDGALYIKSVGAEHRDALAQYAKSLKRFNDFFLNRVIPDDLEM